MPDQFTAFPPANRDPDTEYQSGAYSVPADAPDIMVRLSLTVVDIVNEPDTTVIHWRIERNDGSGWTHMVSTSFRGRNGVTPPKPTGFLSTSINGVRGQDVRGVISFENADGRKMRFGVDGQVY